MHLVVFCLWSFFLSAFKIFQSSTLPIISIKANPFHVQQEDHWWKWWVEKCFYTWTACQKYIAAVLTTILGTTSTKETIVDPTTIIRRVVCMLDEVKFIDTARSRCYHSNLATVFNGEEEEAGFCHYLYYLCDECRTSKFHIWMVLFSRVEKLKCHKSHNCVKRWFCNPDFAKANH